MSTPEMESLQDSHELIEQNEPEVASNRNEKTFQFSQRSACKVMTAFLAFSVVGMLNECIREPKAVAALPTDANNLPQNITVFDDAAVAALEEAVANRKMTQKKADEFKKIIVPEDIAYPVSLSKLAEVPAAEQETPSLLPQQTSKIPVATFVGNELVITDGNVVSEETDSTGLDSEINFVHIQKFAEETAPSIMETASTETESDETAEVSDETENSEDSETDENTVADEAITEETEELESEELQSDEAESETDESEEAEPEEAESETDESEETAETASEDAILNEDSNTKMMPTFFEGKKAEFAMAVSTADEEELPDISAAAAALFEEASQTNPPMPGSAPLVINAEGKPKAVTFAQEKIASVLLEGAIEQKNLSEEEKLLATEEAELLAYQEFIAEITAKAEENKTVASNAGSTTLLGTDIAAALEAKELSEQQAAETSAMISSAAIEAANKAMAAKEAEEMSKYAISVSESDRQLFYGIMASECGARWDYEGCLMIANTITNRVRNGGGSLRAVLTAPGQFTTYSSGMWRTRTATPAQKKAADDALAGKRILDDNVTYFCTYSSYRRSRFFQSLNLRNSYDNTVFFSTW